MPTGENADRETFGTVSRRDLLAGSAAAAAGLAVAHVLPAGAATDESFTAAPTVSFTLNVNGQNYDCELEPRVTLLDALREELGLCGTKKGCDHGQCGACTVLVNGRRINSCLALAVMHQGDQITTIEGLASADELHPLQKAFIEQDAFQCGYCTSGQICSAIGLINEGRAKTDEEIAVQMSGNLCRCGAYTNIREAIKQCL